MNFRQDLFIKALLNPSEPIPKGLTSHDGISARRFAVYRNNVAVGLSEALQTTFPVLLKLLGDEFFRAMAGVFLREYPPESPLLTEFGKRMPAFLSGFQPVQHLPYLPDIARLEIAIGESYHSADSTSVSLESFGSIASEKLLESVFLLSPSLRTLKSRYPVLGIWKFNIEGCPSPENRAEEILIARRRFDPKPHHLAPGGYEFVRAISGNCSLSEAVDRTFANYPNFELDKTLALLIASGAISGICPRAD